MPATPPGPSFDIVRINPRGDAVMAGRATPGADVVLRESVERNRNVFFRDIGQMLPLLLQIATYANPLRFGIDTVRRVYLEGAGFSDVALNFVPLLIVGAITLPLAAWLFRNRLA